MAKTTIASFVEYVKQTPIKTGFIIAGVTVSYYGAHQWWEYTKAKTTDNFLREYSEDKYRVALLELYKFKEKHVPKTEQVHIKEEDVLTNAWQALKNKAQEEQKNEKEKEFDYLESKKRLLGMFALRLNYARKFGILATDEKGETWGPTFWTAIHKIVCPISKYEDFMSRDGDVCKYAKECCTRYEKETQTPAVNTVSKGK